MKRSTHPISWLTALVAGIFVLAAPAPAQNGTQSVTLSAGWNAIWLEVEPVYDSGPGAGLAKSPQDVFTDTTILPADTRIEVVASPKQLAGLSEFYAADPGTENGTFNQDEWQQWKRNGAVNENNLGTITGNRAYLIRVKAGTAPFALAVSGKVRFFRPTWTPDRYNLVGFGLAGTPTFDAFFGPSGKRHPVAKIFRLATDGTWAPVNGTATMVSGQAYWAFSSGPSNYMGPVSVDFNNSVTGALSFGDPSDALPVGTGVDALQLDLKEIIFSNLGAPAASPSLDLIATSIGQGSLALHVVKPTTNSLARIRGNQVDSAPGPGAGAALDVSVASMKSVALTLGAQRNWAIGAPDRTNLYRLNTGGALVWLPVTARNSNIQLPTDGTPATAAGGVAGLWIGEVSINASTSIVEDGAPLRPSAGSVPMRILLHSDDAGAVKLLSQVTIMQTRTADSAVAPTQVLVVDQARIPIFEGVRERNGKRVGLRMEAVAYDMPRDSSTAAQSTGGGDLIDMIVAESTSPVTKWAAGKSLYTTRGAVTQAAIDSFLLFRSIRPPSLKEVYKLSLAMTGAVGAGKTVSTSALTLDPFHRSNPFRHAFHQNLPKGPSISRSIQIVFDPDQTMPDRLVGTFSETIQGLIKSDLELTGRVEFRRVSTVATLEGQ